MGNYKYKAFAFGYNGLVPSKHDCINGIKHVHYGVYNCMKQKYTLYCSCDKELQQWDKLIFRNYG